MMARLFRAMVPTVKHSWILEFASRSGSGLARCSASQTSFDETGHCHFFVLVAKLYVRPRPRWEGAADGARHNNHDTRYSGCHSILLPGHTDA
jgi:hypothetical protein